MVDNVDHLLEKLKYKELLDLIKQENIEVKGKKRAIIRKVSQAVPVEKILEFYRKTRGIKVDIMHHQLVPEHEIMTKDEVQKLLERYKCKTEDLPKVLDTDPMVLKLKAKGGDVLRIGRRSQTAGKAYYYRLVIRSIS